MKHYGKLCKIKSDRTMFILEKHHYEKIIIKNKNEIILEIGDNIFFDFINVTKMFGTSTLNKFPAVYLDYLSIDGRTTKYI